MLDDAVQRSAATGEYCADEALVGLAMGSSQQWRRASADGEDAAVDAGPRREAVRGNPFVELIGEPWRVLRGHHCAAPDPGSFAGYLPLGQQDSVLPGAGGQQPAQERCGQVKRDVAHHGTGAQRILEGISVHDVYRPETLLQPPDVVFVELECRERATKACDRASQGTVAGTDLQDRSTGGVGDDVADARNGGLVGEEILAEFVAAAVGRPWQGGAPSDRAGSASTTGVTSQVTQMREYRRSEAREGLGGTTR